jgi:hypothetical protein
MRAGHVPLSPLQAGADRLVLEVEMGESGRVSLHEQCAPR